MSKSSIPPKIQSAIWAKSGGRCQYRGCNQDLVGDLIAGREDGLYGFIAHIVADSPGGPRGHETRSAALARDLGNLMLMCGKHHKLVDVDAVSDHSEPLLLAMKAEHEARITLVCGIDDDRASHVLRFAASIGQNEALVSTQAIFAAMPPDHRPASAQTIDLELLNCAWQDHEPAYWDFQVQNLRRQFAARVSGRIERQDIRHLSVFALAPQPLLIELGRLLCDIVPATVRHRRREPATWDWATDAEPVVFSAGHPPSEKSGPIALKLAVSGTVLDERIEAVLGPETAIWSLTADEPGNDIIKHSRDLAAFREKLRGLFDTIKAHHGEGQVIQVFPALPASLAVETGRVWMPKADLQLVIYDQQRDRGFVPALAIGAPDPRA